MQTVRLPSGKTAEIRDVETVTERARRPIKRLRMQLLKMPDFAEAITKAGEKKKLTKADQDAIAENLGDATEILEDLNDSLIVAMVSAWDYPGAVTIENVQDLPFRDLDTLREVVSPYLSELMPDFSPSADKETPTGV